MGALTNLWNKYFDKIYVIMYLPDYKDHYQYMVDELTRVGIWDTGKVEFRFSPKSTLKSRFIKDLLPKYFLLLIPYMMDASYDHYITLQIAYQLGYNRILILEDDICFLRDLNEVYNQLLLMPLDMDIVLFDKLYSAPLIKKNAKPINKFYEEYVSNGLNWSAACYAITRKGMEFCIGENDKFLNGPDGILTEKVELMNKLDIHACYAINNVAIQNPKFEAGKDPKTHLAHYPFYIQQGVDLNKYKMN